jgi:ankyrin repeat protein
MKLITEIGLLIDAVIKNDSTKVKNMLQMGVDPNGFLDEAKLRPLHFAAQNNSIESSQLLIAAGANIYACTEPDKETPIKIAEAYGNKKIIDLFLRSIDKINVNT